VHSGDSSFSPRRVWLAQPAELGTLSVVMVVASLSLSLKLPTAGQGGSST
jgi:hypothetical protein